MDEDQKEGAEQKDGLGPEGLGSGRSALFCGVGGSGLCAGSMARTFPSTVIPCDLELITTWSSSTEY